MHRRTRVLEPEYPTIRQRGADSCNILRQLGFAFIGSVLFTGSGSPCHLSLAHLHAGCVQKTPAQFYIPVQRYLFGTISPLYQSTRLMPTFNTLFTHEKQAIYSTRAYVCVARKGWGGMNGPRHLAPICYITV